MDFRNLFRKKTRWHIDRDRYRIEKAFTHGGKDYFHFDNAFEIPAGRSMCALTFYEEMHMRCDRSYLEKHVKAIEILLSDPKKINIMAIATIHSNLKDRLNLAPFPDHIYKLASVMFFDEKESPYMYDFAYNVKKIAAWKNDPDMLDFFLKMRFCDLIPSFDSQRDNVKNYFQVAEMIGDAQSMKIAEILSRSN